MISHTCNPRIQPCDGSIGRLVLSPCRQAIIGPYLAQYVIPSTHTTAAGTTNFNFGCPPTQGRCAIIHGRLCTLKAQAEPLDRACLSRGSTCTGPRLCRRALRSTRGCAASGCTGSAWLLLHALWCVVAATAATYECWLSPHHYITSLSLIIHPSQGRLGGCSM